MLAGGKPLRYYTHKSKQNRVNEMEKFEYNGATYQVTAVNTLDGLENLKKRMIETGKKPVQFHAFKVLKSGELSKSGGMFVQFEKSGRFVKVL